MIFRGTHRTNARLLRAALLATALVGGLSFASGSAEAAKTDEAILGEVRSGSPTALARVDATTMRRLHNYGGKYYYIALEIGQASVRSLLGCFQNTDPISRKLCADNLYQLRLTYVHRRALLFYLQKEDQPPVRLALQDLLVRINEERFAAARAAGDENFLAKIEYSEIADFAEKGYPSGERYTARDFRFLSAGMRNQDAAMQIYTARMLGRIQGDTSSIQKFLSEERGRTRNESLQKAIDESLGCLRNPRGCPDLQQ